VPCALCLAHCILHRTPTTYTLNPTAYTLHPHPLPTARCTLIIALDHGGSRHALTHRRESCVRKLPRWRIIDKTQGHELRPATPVAEEEEAEEEEEEEEDVGTIVDAVKPSLSQKCHQNT